MTAPLDRDRRCSATSSTRGATPAPPPGCAALCADLEAAYPRDAAPRVVRRSPRATRSRGCSRPTPTRSAAVLRGGAAARTRGRCAGRSSPGDVEPGSGPATERTGPAFLVAREAIARARAHRDGLVALTGDPEADALLADLGPLLPRCSRT